MATPMPEILETNEQFERALYLLEKTSQNLFITGKAGTGKSTLLQHFCETTSKKPVVLAPTGVAALNVRGQTIHSFFNFYIDVTPEKIRDRRVKPRDRKVYRNLKTIIIDEISMVRADLMDCVETFLRMYGPETGAPFGGVQMIFVGDLYQLPPVVSSAEQELFTNHYESPYFFSAHGLREVSLEILELEEVYRQKDQDFVTLLNQIRNNSVDEDGLAKLNSRVYEKPLGGKDFYITLTTTNKAALNVNNAHLEALPGKLYKSSAHIDGTFTKEYFPTETDLHFKIGAQIMLLNNDSKKRWVNGSIGVIEGMARDEKEESYLRVRLQDNDKIVRVYPFTWEVFKFAFDGAEVMSEAVGTFAQYPFRLAWAITIHKSQGQTFEHVIVDMGKGSFAAGQTYVALSRCRSMEGMVLTVPLQKSHILTDSRICQYLNQQASGVMPIADKRALIDGAIKAKAPLEMIYLKADDTQTARVIVPYMLGLENHNGQSFEGIRAFCLHAKEDRLFRLDRIVTIDAVS